MKKLIILPDIQYPYHHQPSLEAIEQFMPDFKPDILIYLGDQLDLKIIRDWQEGKIRKIEGKRIIEDYKGFDKILTKHIELCGKPQIIFFEGNHEERLERYLDYNPNWEGMLEYSIYLRFKERNIKFIPFGKTWNIGKLYFTHGPYVIEHHAKKVVKAYGRSVIYGHTHTFQAHTDVSPIDVHDVHTATSIGCLCSKNPDYMKNRPSAWVHGFAIAYIHKNGWFNDYFINITNGKFIFNGKIYGKKN